MNRTAKLLLGAALLGAVALGAAGAQPAPPLPAPVGGEERSLTLEGFGKVAYFADPRGSGRPLILTVSVNAAASGYEMRPLWDAYAGQRPVYLLEWPGFGHSARPDVPYTPELMTRALTALVAQLGQEADVVALSLGSEFAARAALQEPRIRSLALISPSGLGTPRGGSQQGEDARGNQRNRSHNLSPWCCPMFKGLGAVGASGTAAARDCAASTLRFLCPYVNEPSPVEGGKDRQVVRRLPRI